MSNKLAGFILAAGFGERLRPITDHIPKPLLPVLGKPLLQSIIEGMLGIGIRRIGINVHYKKELIGNWIRKSPFSGSITLFEEEPILDTGGALKNAAEFLDGCDVIVHNGDIMSDIRLPELIRRHRTEGNIATLAIHHYPKFNHVAVDRAGLLKGVGKAYEPAGPSEHFMAFTGVAVYSSEFLAFLPDGVSSVVPAWLKAGNAGCRVGTWDVTGCSWSDIGSPSAYASALMGELKRTGENVYIDPGTIGCGEIGLGGNVVIEKEAMLGAASSLNNCVVLPGGRTLKGRAYENCIVGPDYSVPVEESAFAPTTTKGILIGTGGSDRQYFRVKKEDRTVVAMECPPEDQDFMRHIEYTLFFRKYGIPVAEIFISDFKGKTALFEDLGDVSLYTWLKCPRGVEQVETIYRRIMDILVRLHCEASDHVSECPALAGRLFDYDYLRWETGYFIERFVRGLRHMREPGGLGDEFHRMAFAVNAHPKRIIHRDFQSQNIMVTKGGIPRIIDFQGARMAPPAYDIASILWDPYAPLDAEVRERLLGYYISEMSKKRTGWFVETEFAESLLYCRLQRHMQALGAYGFLSEVRGKKYFLRHVPAALRHLKEEAALARDEFPLLYGLAMSL